MDILKSFAENCPTQPFALWRRWWLGLYGLTMPIHHWDITSRAVELFWYLRRLQWMLPEHVAQLQLQRLRRLVHFAFVNVDYYRCAMLELGLRSDDIQSLADIRKLPILEKQAVREMRSNGLLSDDFRERRPVQLITSGSTGEPLEFYVDRFQLEMRWATTWRNFEWAGCQFGDRHVQLWHLTIGMKPVQIAKKRLQAWLCRRMFIPAFGIGNDMIEKSVNRIDRYRPVLVDGYAEALSLLAMYLESRMSAGHGVFTARPRGVISSAQTLSARSRRVIEDTFGCHVYDKYGAREFSGIAHECEFQQMHVNAESYIVEILCGGRPAQPGEVGEVVVTDLNNYAMPFIRYRIGDLATAVSNRCPCPCHRGLPRIGNIEGRTQSIIIGTNGRYLSGTFFAHLLKDWSEVRQFRVEQSNYGQLAVLLVKTDNFSRKTLDRLGRKLRGILGADMKISFEIVDEIPLGRTGKHLPSISHLKVNFDAIWEK